LTSTQSVTIKAYESNGTLLIQSTSHPDIVLSFAYKKIGNIGAGLGLNEIVQNGASKAIYHNGIICIFSNGFIGSTDLTIGGISADYTLLNYYNNITLNTNQKITGTLTSSDMPLFSIPIYYKPASKVIPNI